VFPDEKKEGPWQSRPQVKGKRAKKGGHYRVVRRGEKYHLNTKRERHGNDVLASEDSPRLDRTETRKGA